MLRPAGRTLTRAVHVHSPVRAPANEDGIHSQENTHTMSMSMSMVEFAVTVAAVTSWRHIGRLMHEHDINVRDPSKLYVQNF